MSVSSFRKTKQNRVTAQKLPSQPQLSALFKAAGVRGWSQNLNPLHPSFPTGCTSLETGIAVLC